MPWDHNISNYCWVFHQIPKILDGVVGLKHFWMVIMLLHNLGDDRSIYVLPILLLNHNFSFWIHLLMGLIVLFVLVQNYSMLVWPMLNLCIFRLLLNIFLYFIWLLFLRTVNFWTNVVAELIVEIFLIHSIFFLLIIFLISNKLILVYNLS